MIVFICSHFDLQKQLFEGKIAIFGIELLECGKIYSQVTIVRSSCVDFTLTVKISEIIRL